MKAAQTYEYVLRATDFDCRRQLLPSAVLGLFQDAAGKHATELGVGYDAMLARKILWVLVRVRYQVEKMPPLYSRVRVTTWPLPSGKASCRRDYLIEDENGNLYIRGTSDWAFIHSEERRLLPVGDVYPLEVLCSDMAFGDKTRKLPDFEPQGEAYIVTPGFCDLDMNGHVNNTKYANFVLDAVVPREGEEIDTFQIDFRKEVMAGSRLSVLSRRGDGEIAAKGLDEDGTVHFVCQMSLKDRP